MGRENRQSGEGEWSSSKQALCDLASKFLKKREEKNELYLLIEQMSEKRARETRSNQRSIEALVRWARAIAKMPGGRPNPILMIGNPLANVEESLLNLRKDIKAMALQHENSISDAINRIYADVSTPDLRHTLYGIVSRLGYGDDLLEEFRDFSQRRDIPIEGTVEYLSILAGERGFDLKKDLDDIAMASALRETGWLCGKLGNWAANLNNSSVLEDLIAIAGETPEDIGEALEAAFEVLYRFVEEPNVPEIHRLFKKAQTHWNVDLEGIRFERSIKTWEFESPVDQFTYDYVHGGDLWIFVGAIEKLLAAVRAPEDYLYVDGSLINKSDKEAAENMSEDELREVLDNLNSLISGRQEYGLRLGEHPETGVYTKLVWSNGSASWNIINSAHTMSLVKKYVHGEVGGYGFLDANIIIVPYPAPVIEQIQSSLYPLPLYRHSFEGRSRSRSKSSSGFVSDRQMKTIVKSAAFMNQQATITWTFLDSDTYGHLSPNELLLAAKRDLSAEEFARLQASLPKKGDWYVTIIEQGAIRNLERAKAKSDEALFEQTIDDLWLSSGARGALQNWFYYDGGEDRVSNPRKRTQKRRGQTVIRVKKKDIKVREIGSGSFATAFVTLSRRAPKVYVVEDDEYGDEAKDILAEINKHARPPHIPKVRFLGRGRWGKNLSRRCRVFEMPLYKVPLRKKHSKKAWLDYRILSRCWKEAMSSVDSKIPDTIRAFLMSGRKVMDETIDCAEELASLPLIRSLKTLRKYASKRGGHWTFEFQPRNLGTDKSGRLILLDPIFSLRDVSDS